METWIAIVIIAAIIVLLITVLCHKRDESFLAEGQSSAFDWNTGPGYGDGYGTGYAMWGIWPGWIPGVPWQNWMWKRTPSYFENPYTQVPQIDYTHTPKVAYEISVVGSPSGARIAVDGVPGKSLYLDRNRNYYFRVYAPNEQFTIKNADDQDEIEPLDMGVITLNFTDEDPDTLFYSLASNPASGGVIYLQNLSN